MNTAPPADLATHRIDVQFQFISTGILSIQDIEDLIVAASNKHCALNPVPMSVVKKCSSLLTSYIQIVFNRSLFELCTCFAEGCTRQSIAKKSGMDKEDTKTYRPLSNLTFCPNSLSERFVDN